MSEPILSLIPFRGQEILSITQDARRYIVPKQICQNLGLDWEGQRQKIQRDTVLSEGTCMIQVPSMGGSQETLCLPFEYLNGWLFGIDDSRVRIDIRESVIAYKRECYVVLYEYFQKGASIDIERLDEDTELQDFLYRRIRQARTSERSLWERVKTAFKEGSTDYEENPEMVKKFYSLAQDKIHYAVTKKTAAELVYERIENNPDNRFGMQAFDREKSIKLRDMQTGKNYLDERELLQYENIGEQLLLRIELRLLRGGRITVEEWFFEINRLLSENGYEILFDYSKAKHSRIEANAKVDEIYSENKQLLKSEKPKKLLSRDIEKDSVSGS